MRQIQSQALIIFVLLVAACFPVAISFNIGWTQRQTPTKCYHHQRHTRTLRPVFFFQNRNTAVLNLAATADDKSNNFCVVQRLDLTDQFSRWKFLQKLLDAEVSASDANELLYRVLYSFITYPPAPSDKSEDSNVSPIPTEEKIEVIESLFRTDENGNGSVFALRDPECSPGHESVLAVLEERLLPDPREDEDAHKGTWDTVMEIHGRESVKVREQEGSKGWKARCAVARVLIYFDFLTHGVVAEPFS